MSQAELTHTHHKAGAGTGKVDLSLVKAEISFWQEMIKFRDASMTDESLERMQQALALAQTRLIQHTKVSPSTPGPNNHSNGNVYFINAHRN